MPDGLNAPALIEAKGASAARAGRTVLSGINFRLHPGEIVTVVGPNGSGKSTFINLLIGTLETASGNITRKRGLRIGYVPQQLHIDATLPLTVERFLRLGISGHVSNAGDALARVGLSGFERRQMAALSGGERQRVLLARALSGTPELLVLDEPTQGLDQPATAAFYRLIEQVRRDSGCAVLMVSHDLHVVMSASDRVICINGHICCEGAPQIVSEAPEYRAMFGTGTKGALALYQHHHDHDHEHPQGHHHGHEHGDHGTEASDPQPAARGNAS